MIMEKMNNLKYSIIYGVIRPEISEQLSIGIVYVEDENISVRYSLKKLELLKALFTEQEYDFVRKVLCTLDENESFKSTDSINYLTRYSNNLIALSQLQTINLAPTEGSKDWLYRNYVYAG